METRIRNPSLFTVGLWRKALRCSDCVTQDWCTIITQRPECGGTKTDDDVDLAFIFPSI